MFEREVGSSFDPELEDMAALEHEFVRPPSCSSSSLGYSEVHLTLISLAPAHYEAPWEEEDAELAARAMEYDADQNLNPPSCTAKFSTISNHRLTLVSIW
jgi:hypothetical protein